MNRDEMNLALGWATAEGWNVGLQDADCFYAADPQGFVVALENDEPVGCISAVSYGTSFGFLGLFIVRPDKRGKGCGKRLWNEAMTRLKGRVAGLDAVTAREGLYAKMGFHPAHRSTCHVIKAEHSAASSPQIRHLAHEPFANACAIDRQHFPADRNTFLDALVRAGSTHSFAAVSDGAMRGWGAIRECQGGWKIGPFYAETDNIAEDLYNALQNSVPEGADIFIATPHSNAKATTFAARHGMKEVFDTVRMYNGPDPRIESAGIYSLAGFELG